MVFQLKSLEVGLCELLRAPRATVFKPTMGRIYYHNHQTCKAYLIKLKQVLSKHKSTFQLLWMSSIQDNRLISRLMLARRVISNQLKIGTCEMSEKVERDFHLIQIVLKV